MPTSTTPPKKYSNREKASEAHRECQMRRHVYSRNHPMRPQDVIRLAIMAQIADDYDQLVIAEKDAAAPKLPL